MTDYKDLIVWQKSMDLVEEIYVLTSKLPDNEIYALSNQMRRAAVSLPSNIAEGNGRSTGKDYVKFLTIARGSKSELETQLYICLRLKYLTPEQTEKAFILCAEVGRMLNSLINKIKTNP